jgi:diguanylate cyclase
VTDTNNPIDIAREALKQLTLRKLSPTPANYQACYNEAARLPNVAGFPEAQLRQILTALRVKHPVLTQHLERFETAIGNRSWLAVQDALLVLASAASGTSATKAQTDNRASELTTELLARIRRLIEDLLPALGSEDEWLFGQAHTLLQTLQGPAVDMQALLGLLTGFSQRASLAAEEQVEIKELLLKLLHLIIENIGELTLDQQCIQGQIDSLVRAVAPPLSLRRLDDAERRLQEVIDRQHDAKTRTLEAQEAMRQMLAAFIDQLTAMNHSSTDFQNNLEQSASEISEVRTLEDLTPLLQRVIDATRAMAQDTASARGQLEELQDKVLTTDAELAKLHEELHHASASARHDPLTDALNRRGLAEALAREIASMQRKDSPLCVSLLDVDNFKKINDRLGHATGDEALVHLVNVVRHYMRPIDTLARYGGEEFVILMPDTRQEEGIETMKRLQRELTKNFFLTGNERILITFSAGVTQLTSDESGEEAIRRADQAMYLAKRTGKNRVLGG